MKTVELTEEQCKMAVEALGYYQDLICAGDVEGTDKDLDTLQNVISNITRGRRKKNITKTVYILTYNDLGYDGQRSIYGVYADEDSATDAMNDELLLPLRECFNDEEQLLSVIDPDVEEHKIY